MTGDSRLSARFGAETTDFKQGITAINRELKLIESEFKATASTMDDWSNTSKGLEARIGALTKEIALQGEKTNALRERTLQMAQAHGENSIEAKNAAIEYNKEAEKLGKLQTELGQTERGLKGMENTSKGVRGAFKNLGTQFDNLKQQVPAVGSAFALLTNPISLVVAGLTAFTAISKDSVTKLVAYNKQIRETSQLTGLSAEETSRLVQVADDWGLEMDAATKAMELMNKKGYTPSIDNLAKIADEYANATDKTLFIEEATKKYGKSFGDLVPILAKGGDALREQAASISDNLIATEDSMRASREYEEAMDELGDTVTGLKNNLGKGLLPAIIAVTKGLNELIVSNMDIDYAVGLANKAYEAGTISMKEYDSIRKDIVKRTYENNRVLQDLVKTEKAYIQYSEAVNREDEIRRAVLPEVTEEVNTLTDSITTYGRELDGLTRIKVVKALEDQAKAAEDLQQAYDDLSMSIDGQLGPEMDDFTKKQDDLKKKMEETAEEINTALLQGYDDTSEKVLGLKGDYDELKGQYEENDTAHATATKHILYDILTQRAAIGGLTADEVKFLEEIANAWGLIDTATVTAVENTDAALNWLANHPDDVAGAKKILEGQATAWDLTMLAAQNAAGQAGDYANIISGLHDKTITVTTNYVSSGSMAPGYGPPGGDYEHYTWNGYTWVPKGHSGLDMIVPPGHPNDSFPIMAESGERVIIIPPGKQFGNSLANMQQLFTKSTAGLNSQAGIPAMGGGGGSVNNSWQYVIQAANPLQTAGDLVRQVRLLELMHR